MRYGRDLNDYKEKQATTTTTIERAQHRRRDTAAAAVMYSQPFCSLSFPQFPPFSPSLGSTNFHSALSLSLTLFCVVGLSFVPTPQGRMILHPFVRFTLIR